MERKFIRHRNAREVKISGSSNPRARARDRIICFGIDDGPKIVRGKGPKIDAMPGMRAAGSATCFISTALRPRYYRRQFFKPRHTAVVRHFRLTGISRASGEKRPNLRVDAAMLYHRKSRRAVFSGEVRGPKNVPSRIAVESIFKKKFTFSSTRVKRSGRKREQTNER